MKLLTILVWLGFLGACSSGMSSQTTNKDDWALKLADAVMSRNDSLAIYNNPSSINFHYDLAMLGQAIEELGSTDVRFSNYNKNFVDLFIREDGSVATYKEEDFNLDNYSGAKSLLELYQQTSDKKYRLAIERLIDQLHYQPRTGNGGYCHKEIYMHQIWLNSAYMLDPFLARYARDFKQTQWFDSACFQLTNTYQILVDKKDGLMFHAWDETHKQIWANPQTGKSPNKWGRGMGWYTMALVDVLEYLPVDHPERKVLKKILTEVSISLLKVRDKDTGLWFQILDQGDREYNYIETSCSSMFIYTFAKGANLGVLPEEYKEIALESFNSLTARYIKTDADLLPTLTHICGPAGLGVKLHRDGSFEYYINQQQIDNDPKGVAPLIMAAIELK
ncbi:MAG: glycoside hydrolase family 105 protein [Prolixibacteraceae bacterium]